MEFGKVIPEAEEALEHSLMMSPMIDHKPPATALKEIARDVDTIISRFPFHRSQMQPQPQPQTPDTPNHTIAERKLPETPIGKYNPIGQLYRYEQAEFHMQVSKPQLKETSKTQQLIEPVRHQHNFSVRDHDSVFAEESLTNSEIKFPSHNYYIMFDRKHPHPQPKVSRTVCLQRKVQKLQNEVKQLKGSGTISTNFRRSDGKMKLERLLNSMIG